MNLKLKAALYTIIPFLGTAIWLFSLSTWYVQTVLFTIVFLLFIALPFVVYNLIYHYLIDKQDMIAYRQSLDESLDANKRASEKIQHTIDAMRGKND